MRNEKIGKLLDMGWYLVSVRLGTLSQSFIQDQRRSTNISRCHTSKLFQETRIQRLAVWKRCDLLVLFLFSNLMASDLMILCLEVILV